MHPSISILDQDAVRVPFYGIAKDGLYIETGPRI